MRRIQRVENAHEEEIKIQGSETRESHARRRAGRSGQRREGRARVETDGACGEVQVEDGQEGAQGGGEGREEIPEGGAARPAKVEIPARPPHRQGTSHGAEEAARREGCTPANGKTRDREPVGVGPAPIGRGFRFASRAPIGVGLRRYGVRPASSRTKANLTSTPSRGRGPTRARVNRSRRRCRRRGTR